MPTDPGHAEPTPGQPERPEAPADASRAGAPADAPRP
ncbi:TetR family transcriptional regulator, partial [Streptomyces sp. SID8380]|nr:TetR family transcriptional regulator [Streptomyces sp. SID8380]